MQFYNYVFQGVILNEEKRRQIEKEAISYRKMKTTFVYFVDLSIFGVRGFVRVPEPLDL